MRHTMRRRQVPHGSVTKDGGAGYLAVVRKSITHGPYANGVGA